MISRIYRLTIPLPDEPNFIAVLGDRDEPIGHVMLAHDRFMAEIRGQRNVPVHFETLEGALEYASTPLDEITETDDGYEYT